MLIQKARGLRSKANSARSEQKYCNAIMIAVEMVNNFPVSDEIHKLDLVGSTHLNVDASGLARLFCVLLTF
jgi:hypothetical protein